MKITPSLFTDIPWESIFQNYQTEIVARNVMIILSRTGNKFRSLSWDEYKEERLKDNNFQEGEKDYFIKVNYLSEGDEKKILNFSSEWKDSYIKQLENKEK